MTIRANDMRAFPSLSRWLAGALAVCLTGLSGHAQSPVTLTLDEALAAALQDNPDVRIARAANDGQRGTLVQTRAPFDFKPLASIANSRTVRAIDTSPLANSYSELNTASTLALDKLFRSGIGVSVAASLDRRSPNMFQGVTLNEVTASGTVTVPLRQGRNGGVLTASERAATKDYEANQYALRAVAASAVYRTAVAYWQYRAAGERAEIQSAAAARSEQLVNEVQILIQADERPRSDIDLIIANAATKRVARIQAAQEIVAARSNLALALGRDAPSAAALSMPATALPAVDAAPLAPVDALIAATLARHDDLAAARRRQEGARVLRNAAVLQLQPRVDVVLGFGFIGRPGASALSNFTPPAGVLGPNASVGLVFDPSTINAQIRGALITADALSTEAQIQTETVARTIGVNVAEAAAELDNSRTQLQVSDEAVARSRLALATVQRNFEFGTVTIFDRIVAEDTLTNAQLTDLSAHLGYAGALAKLQYARGILVEVSGNGLTVRPERLLRPREEVP